MRSQTPPSGRPSSSASSDPAGALKKYVSRQTEECIENISKLAHDLSKSGASEVLAKLPQELAAKGETISRTGRLLEQMPPVIANLDAYLDYAIRDAMGVPEVLELLRGGQAQRELAHGEDKEG